MSNELMVLEFESQQIRMVGTPDRPEWVAADVCRILGIAEPQNTLRHFMSTERGRCIVDTPPTSQKMLTVTEPGLYRLILKSRKPEAERLRVWLTHDVLPSIRQHGCYPPPELSIRETALVRIDEEALGRAIGSALTPRFESIDARFDQVDEQIGELREVVSSIEVRRRLTDRVERLHVQVCHRMCGGICPCCGITRVVNQAGERLGDVIQFDHWTLRSQNGPDKTWPVCRDCNQKLRDGDFHDECEVLFKAYQARRRQLEQIVSPDRRQGKLGFPE